MVSIIYTLYFLAMNLMENTYHVAVNLRPLQNEIFASIDKYHETENIYLHECRTVWHDNVRYRHSVYDERRQKRVHQVENIGRFAVSFRRVPKKLYG
jgi:hypothetical protein